MRQALEATWCTAVKSTPEEAFLSIFSLKKHDITKPGFPR
jgi:hypothetical protein